MGKSIIVLFFILSQIYCYSQNYGTARVMQLNLLAYGNNTQDCDANNNSLPYKNQYLKEIISYVKPDIFTVNEIKNNYTIIDSLLHDVLNINNINYYKRGSFSNVAGSSTVNMLYYNSNKFTLESQSSVITGIRDIDIYKLYYNSPDTLTDGKVYINCIVAHLKSGNTAADTTKRAEMTDSLMKYLHNIGADNYLLMGDFNVQKASEPAFQNLIYYSDTAVRFYDPVNMIASWNGDVNYAAYHTQSTNTTASGNVCKSTGGFNSRYDFILISKKIKLYLNKVHYIPNSYKALGQDGQHFGKAINDAPTNTIVPANIITALLNVSDHLPIILDLEIKQTPSASINNMSENGLKQIYYNNPVDNEIKIFVNDNDYPYLNVEIISILGQTLYKKQYNNVDNNSTLSISFDKFKNGLYLLKIEDKNGNRFVGKIIKN